MPSSTSEGFPTYGTREVETHLEKLSGPEDAEPLVSRQDTDRVGRAQGFLGDLQRFEGSPSVEEGAFNARWQLLFRNFVKESDGV